MFDTIYAVEFQGNRIDLIPGVDLYNHDFNNLPNRDIKSHKLARRSETIVTSSEWTDKTIPVMLEVCGGTRSDTEAVITTIKSLVAGQNGKLRGLQSNLMVEYTATLQDMSKEWDGVKCYLTLEFFVSSPLGESVETLTLLSVTGNTLQSLYNSIQIEGSGDAEPTTTIIVSAVTGGTNASMSIYNGLTNQGITITDDFVDGDVVQINSTSMQVTINGVIKDFKGLFPIFGPGSQQLNYSDTFTTRTVDIDVKYKPRLI